MLTPLYFHIILITNFYKNKLKNKPYIIKIIVCDNKSGQAALQSLPAMTAFLYVGVL